MEDTKTYTFKVKGNTGIYDCTFKIERDSFINTCNCKAAQDDMLCWHRSYVLSGLEEFIINNNRNDQLELIRRAATTRGGFNMLKYARDRFLNKQTNDIKKTGGSVLKVLGIIFIIFIVIGVIAVITGPKKEKEKGKENLVENSKDNFPKEPIWDIPSLLKLSPKEILKKLGKPDEEMIPTREEKKGGDYEANATYFKNGFMLIVTYDLQYGSMLTDLFLGRRSGRVNDYRSLLSVGNIAEDENMYTLKPVPVLGETGFTGIIIKSL